MVLPQVLEGTWEEIKLHNKELAGWTLKFVIAPKQEPLHTEPACMAINLLYTDGA